MDKAKLAARFFSYVGPPRHPSGCREWNGYVKPNGYGMFMVSACGVGMSELAHRVAYAIGNDNFGILRLYGGGGRRGPVIRHSVDCEFKRCVEFTHLTLGTQKDNIDDNRVNGKMLRGEKIGTATLTDDDAAAMKRLYLAARQMNGGIRPARGVMSTLAEAYGVGRTVVWAIGNGSQRPWLDVTPDASDFAAIAAAFDSVSSETAAAIEVEYREAKNGSAVAPSGALIAIAKKYDMPIHKAWAVANGRQRKRK